MASQFDCSDPDFQNDIHAHFKRMLEEFSRADTDVPFDYPDRRAHSGTGRRI